MNSIHDISNFKLWFGFDFQELVEDLLKGIT